MIKLHGQSVVSTAKLIIWTEKLTFQLISQYVYNESFLYAQQA